MSWLYYLDNIEVVVPYRNAYDSGSCIKRRFNPSQCDIFELDERVDLLETVEYGKPLTIEDWLSTESIPGNEPTPIVFNIYSKTVLYKTDEGIWIKAVYRDRDREPFAERIDSREAVLEIIAHGHNIPRELLGSIDKEWILGFLNEDMRPSQFQSIIRSERKYDELIFTEQRLCRRFYHIHSFIKALTNGAEPDYEFPKRLIEKQYRWRRIQVSYNPPIAIQPIMSPTDITNIDTEDPISRSIDAPSAPADSTETPTDPVIPIKKSAPSKEEMEAFNLYMIQSWKQKDIAEHQGVNQATVSRRIRKVKSQLGSRSADESHEFRPKMISVDPSKIDTHSRRAWF